MNKYFVMMKPSEGQVNDDSNDTLISTKKKYVYILPQSNLRWYTENGLFEKDLMEWSKQFSDKGKVMLDIGAHTGTYSISFAHLFKHIYSFEPQKMTYYALCGSIALSGITNVTCHNFGLGETSQAGNQKLKIISVDGGGSGLHNTSNVIAEESIEIKTLDSLNLNDIGFIKMDVEGNELQTLKGAVETLKRCNYPRILFECNPGSPFELDLFEFIQGLGYRSIKIQNCNNMFLASK